MLRTSFKIVNLGANSGTGVELASNSGRRKLIRFDVGSFLRASASTDLNTSILIAPSRSPVQINPGDGILLAEFVSSGRNPASWTAATAAAPTDGSPKAVINCSPLVFDRRVLGDIVCQTWFGTFIGTTPSVLTVCVIEVFEDGIEEGD